MTDNTKRIEQAKELLTMIEGVDLDNGSFLQELDARFKCCLVNIPFVEISYDSSTDENSCVVGNGKTYYFPQYHCCRNTLKEARPPEWKVIAEGYQDQFVFELTKCVPAAEDYLEDIELSSPYLPTEELAEFHAIIQAWIYVWENE